MLKNTEKAARLKYIKGGLGYQLERFSAELDEYIGLLSNDDWFYAAYGRKASLKRRILSLRADLLRISRILDGEEK